MPKCTICPWVLYQRLWSWKSKSMQFVKKQAPTISIFGANIPLIAICTVSIWSFLYFKGYKIESLLFLTTLGSNLLALLLKEIFKTKRPKKLDPLPLVTGDEYSFPSSHTLFYTVFFGFLIYLSFGVTLAPFAKWILRCICLYLIAFIGVSRVALGIHWWKDIIAGYILGGIYLFLLIVLAEHFI